ncbi:MAG: PAS domain S-box protein [Deltaproteobacteria bacterium]|nr:PAS domain S-box protein [Deltaproteobacteria bacterium]
MSLYTKAVRRRRADPAAAYDLQKGIFPILEEVFDKFYPVVLLLAGVALAFSLAQTLAGKGSYGFFFAQLLILLGFVVAVLLRRRLSPLLVFYLILIAIYFLAVASLYNRGLAGSGSIHMIFFCVLAGIYLSFRKAITILAAGVATALLMAFGFCTGLFAMKPDSADYLLQPVNWLLQLSCIVLYAVSLILSVKGFLQKIIESQAALRESNLRLEAEIGVRQGIEAKLRNSEEEYRNMFENAVEGIFRLSGRGRLISANPALAQMMGYASSEEMIAAITDVKTQGYVDGADRIRLVERLKRQQQVIGQEVRMYRKDRSLAWVSVNCRAVRDPEGQALYYEGSLEDITKRKEAEQALIESEANYRSVVESSVAGFFTVQDGLFRFINGRASEITGYGYDEVVNVMETFETVHPDDQPLAQEKLAQCLAQKGALLPFDCRIVCKNGTIITCRFLIGRTLYHDEPAVSGTFIDITREKSLEAELRQAQKMQAVGQLAGGIAHDFNNILTAFNGYGQLLQMKTPQEDPRRSYVDQILSAAQKAESLTQNLLTFSRQQPITLEPVEINQHIREMEKLLRRLLTEDIAFTIHLSGRPLTTLADATQIDRILFNLVTNARDAMPQGGQLRMETGSVVLGDDFREFHGFGKPGRYASITLADRGIGMDKATVEQIYNPFFTTKEPGEGTGLGLATVYGIVKQHGGYITVDSKPGRGTTFCLYFPEIETAAADKEEILPESFPGGRETILVADDNEDVRAFIKDVFDLAGYRTIEAIDGADAVRRFRETPDIDLVILDTVMPKMNGREAFEAIKMEAPSVKILFVSGYTRDIVLNKGIGKEEFNFLPKPLSPATLLAKVREMLDR